jgi:transcription elongation factor/antiterminator RfaH
MTAAAATRDRMTSARAGERAGERLDLGVGERWYVAMTAPGKERIAQINLANQGFRVFLPRQLATRRHAHRFRTVLAPVFPRYLFVIVDLERARWRSVNGTIGVQRLIADAERPIAVAPGIVETLIQSTDGGGALVFQADAFAIGDRVRLRSGPFAGSLGVLQRLDGVGRVQVLLELLGGSIKLSVERKSVAAIG